MDKQGNDFMGTLAMNDPNGRVDINGRAVLDGANSNYDVNIVTDGLNLARWGITDKYPDHRLTAHATASFWGNSLDNASGHIQVEDFSFADHNGKGWVFNNLQLNADNNGYDKVINVESDHLSGYISGQYDFKTIVPTVKHMLSNAFPQYFGEYANYSHGGEPNDVRLNFVITPDEALHKMHNLPFKLAYRTVIEGNLIVPFPETDERPGIIGVHHPDTLAFLQPFIPGSFFLFGEEDPRAIAGLVALQRRSAAGSFPGRQVFLNGLKVL